MSSDSLVPPDYLGLFLTNIFELRPTLPVTMETWVQSCSINVSIIGFHGISSVSLDHLLGLFTSELVNLTWPTIWQLVGNLDAMLVCEFSVET